MPRLPPALLVALLLTSLAWATPMATHADGPDVDSVAADLICQCRCGLTVKDCGGAMECTIGDEMKAVIAELLDEGMTKGGVLDYFKASYGEAILAAPTKEGFNLSAWITPFAGIAAGAVLVSWATWAWVRRRRKVTADEPARREDEALDPYRERVDRDLQTLE